MMKVFVLCDRDGNVESIAIPDASVAGRVGLEAEAGGKVYELDVDPRAMSRDDLLAPKSEAARKKVYQALRRRVAARRAR